MPRFDAASISIKSMNDPESIEVQLEQIPSGSKEPGTGFKQFIAFARTLAVEVFPVPLGPQNR